jgi:hypothetical protein
MAIINSYPEIFTILSDDLFIVSSSIKNETTKNAKASTLNTYFSNNAVSVANDFTDDTAAATGGINVGGLYHTSGVVKVRIA